MVSGSQGSVGSWGNEARLSGSHFREEQGLL